MVSRVQPACQPVLTSRYAPKPVCVSLGSIMPMAWNGAAIHQSIAVSSVVAVVELTWILPFCAAASPCAVFSWPLNRLCGVEFRGTRDLARTALDAARRGGAAPARLLASDLRPLRDPEAAAGPARGPAARRPVYCSIAVQRRSAGQADAA